MGLDITLEVDDVSKLKERGKYPEHFMNAAYLRSSYNSSGFNNFVPILTGDPIIEHYAQAAYIAYEFCVLAIDTIKAEDEVEFVWSG